MEQFNHAYYQGLLIEIGHYRNSRTYVPPQDQHKLFIDKFLGDLIDLRTIPQFTFESLLRKHYRNSWTFHLGAQYDITKRFQGRIGMMVDTTPVNKQHYNPETPGMTKIEPSIGFSFFPLKNFSIDASLLYVAGLGENNASCTYEDMLLKAMGQPYQKTFTADYSVHAWNPSIGLTFKF